MPNINSDFIKFKNTGVWNYFLREKVDGCFVDRAKCSKCPKLKILKCTGGSTKGLHDHLKLVHNINIQNGADESSFNQTESQTSKVSPVPPKRFKGAIDDFFVNQKNISLADQLSQMTSCDGLPFRVFTTSQCIRKGLEAQGFSNIPKSPSTIKKIVIEHGKAIKKEIKNEIAMEIRNGKRLSITFDEWTSNRNRRYLNINIQSQNKIWNLGMVRLRGTMPAEKLIPLIEEKLMEFDVSLNQHIVAICTDGASVMTKVGKLLSVDHQLCYAHAIHLAITDVLYKPVCSQSCLQQLEIQGEISDDLCENEWTDDENDDNNSKLIFTQNCDFEVTMESTLFPELSNEYLPLVEKVRKIVKIFRRSPTKNEELLQKHVRSEFGKEINLILDCPTRWNSLQRMLTRFCSLKKCILKGLIDISSSLLISTNEFDLIAEIATALEPVTLAAEAICRRNINLVEAEAAIGFSIKSLEIHNTNLSNRLANTIRQRINQRRCILSGILQYLINPFISQADSQFPILKNSIIRTKIVKLLERLSSEPLKLLSTEVDSARNEYLPSNDLSLPGLMDLQTGPTEPIEMSLKDMLQKTMKESIHHPSIRNPRSWDESTLDFDEIVKLEMMSFKNNLQRGPNLQKIYEYILSVPATSTESERVFSSAGNICTKARSSLSDDSIDTMCLLRSYYKNRN